MDIVIDISSIQNFFNQRIDIILWQIFWWTAWMPFAYAFFTGAKMFWFDYVWGQYASTQKKVLIAIDIPKGNEQSPKAVESIFAYFAGGHTMINMFERWWQGKYQPSMSLEIVSIEGYTQFIIYVPSQGRDFIESAIYSQYPDAEITEIEDYTKNLPTKFPDDIYDLWGGEWRYRNREDIYPMKTYKDFEHTTMEGVEYKDTMANLMDLYSTLGKDEQLWMQIIIRAREVMDQEFIEAGEKEVRTILGEEKKQPYFMMRVWLAISKSVGFLFGFWKDILDESEEDPWKMYNLKPKEKKQIEAIQEKASKIGFDTKIRTVYIAKKDVFRKPFMGVTGFFKQFSDPDLNSIGPDMDKTIVTANYFSRQKRLNQRKTKIIDYYISRDPDMGRNTQVMNIEELASLWHFPLESAVKAPLIQKTVGKQAEPPMGLPVSEVEGRQRRTESKDIPRESSKLNETKLKPDQNKTPSNLPFV